MGGDWGLAPFHTSFPGKRERTEAICINGPCRKLPPWEDCEVCPRGGIQYMSFPPGALATRQSLQPTWDYTATSAPQALEGLSDSLEVARGALLWRAT